MLNNCLSYEEYIKNATIEDREFIDTVDKKNNVSRDIAEKIKSIKKSVDLLVFAEAYCKDCAVVLSFLSKMEKLNENINIKILPRKGNENILKEYNKDQRIPTIINLTDNKKSIFSEFPSIVKKEILNNISEKNKIISEFRSGKYNDYVQNELSQILI